MGNALDDVLGSLGRDDAGDDGLTAACQTVEGWAKDGRVADLVALADAIEARSTAPKVAAFETLADHVEDQLALAATPASVEALFGLAAKDRVRSVEVPRPTATRLRAFASRLGFGSADVFFATLDRIGEGRSATDRELLACWMHELVLGGTALDQDPRAVAFERHLTEEKHPLGGLPLSLLATEREAPSYMPLYGDKGLGRAIERLASGPMSARTIPPPADGGTVKATARDDGAIAARMGEAVRPWQEGSNGKIEAKVFDLAPSVGIGSLGSWLLRALPLESTAGAPRLEVSRTGADAVFGALFAAASNGGAYSAGLGAAYGRLAAWASLGALVDAAPDADILTRDARVGECAFLTFRAPGPWFFDVAWDLGALALRADGKTVAVLAASDS